MRIEIAKKHFLKDKTTVPSFPHSSLFDVGLYENRNQREASFSPQALRREAGEGLFSSFF